MSSFKRAKVVMLSTNEKAENCLILNVYNRLNYTKGLLTQSYLKSEGIKPQHLYITSDEEIIEDSINKWFIGLDDKIYLWNGIIGTYRVIIATTDESLNDKVTPKDREYTKALSSLLSQPSQSFIEKYIEAYNAGKPITEVNVEYNRNTPQIGSLVEEAYDILKVNPKDNTITIKKVKDSWSREEVRQLIFNAITDINSEDLAYQYEDGSGHVEIKEDRFNTWIDKNL